MSVWDTIAPQWAVERTERRFLGMLGFVAVTLIGLHVFKQLLPMAYWSPNSWKVYVPLAGGVLGAACFVFVRYETFDALLKASLRASAAGLLVMLLLERPDFTLANVETAARAAEYVSYGYFVALASAAIALLRPSFIVPATIYLMSTRILVQPISGLEMSTLDIRYMLDMSLYLSLLGLAVVTVGKILPWLGSPDRQSEVVGVGFGLHLGNYFWSGVAKVMAGPTPWYWITDNKTFNQIPYTIESGVHPLGHLPWLEHLAYEGLKFANVPLNAAVVAVQLFAIVCVFRVNWLKLSAIVYDALHIGIYVFGGLFFWPWIWNNVTVLWAASKAKEGLSLNTKIACFAAILLGAPALNLNKSADLAWFDVADARQVYFEAVTADGDAVKVPSAFFLSHSYSVSHAYMGAHQIEGMYPYTMLSSSDSVARNEADGTCPAMTPAEPGEKVETAEDRAARQDQLSRLLRAHHEKMLAREASFGPGNFYFHLHHHPSNPFLYPEFNKLSLKDVTGYNLVIRSVCHRMSEGRTANKVVASNTEYFDVR
jgi:hypothetical protein